MEWKRSDVATSGVSSDDLAITDDRYGVTMRLLACACGFRFADPAELPDLLALYGDLDDPGYTDGEGPRRSQQRALLEAVRRVVPGARTLLDVGAASGLLVAEATAVGMDATGIEPSEKLSRGARSSGLHVVTGSLPHPALDGCTYDVVTLVDVIEHVADPVGLLRAARSHVAARGVLLVVTPDAGAVAARVLRRRWWHLRIAHISYFTRPSLVAALGEAGLQPVHWWRPGWVFEVGYLVERLGRYLPGLRRLVAKAGDRRVLRRTLPLNLRDSLAVFAIPRAGESALDRHLG